MAVVYWKRNRTLAVGEFEGYAHEFFVNDQEDLYQSALTIKSTLECIFS